jgi:hypothetical protein
MTGDCTIVVATGVITCTKTNNTAFGALATTTTNAPVIALWTGTCGSGTYLRGDGTCSSPSGGVGAPASVTLLSKTATYAGSTSDFSNGSIPPTIVEFSLSAISQTYTLLSSAPVLVNGNMPCTILKNVTAPYILSVLTGGSTTLDGVAFASVGFPLGPGQSAVVCSDGTNYHTQGGLGVAQSLISNTGGGFFPFYPQVMSNSQVSAGNVIQAFAFHLGYTAKVTNITYQYAAGAGGSTGDWGIADTSGNMLTHTGGVSTSTAGPGTITGSVTSGTIGSGHTMTQTGTGVNCTSTNAPTGSQSLVCNNFSGTANSSSVWTDGTTSGTYTPTAAPTLSAGPGVATVPASPAIILPPGNYIVGLCDTNVPTFQFTGIVQAGSNVSGNWAAQVVPVGTITGSVTSGTIGASHTMTQASTGENCTSTNAPTGSQSLACKNFSGPGLDGTHTWTDGTTSGVYTPTALPIISSAAVVGQGTMATSCTSGVLPSTWGAFTATSNPAVAIPVILVGP